MVILSIQWQVIRKAMKIILALLVAFVVAAQAGNVKEEAEQFKADSDENVMKKWKQFKEKHGKKYSDAREVVGM